MWPRPIVIAHRGASADRPEHTLAAYELAIAQGADVIEPDLVATKDGHLVARHENDITHTTDVADHPQFQNRFRQQIIDGNTISGWFTEDFTLAELKQLRARERLPDLRPANRAYDIETIPTFAEILDLLARAEAQTGRRIGVYPETKHPSHFRRLGLPLEEPMLQLLHSHGRDKAGAFIQSFEVGNLQQLRRHTDLPLVQLIESGSPPPDRPDLSPENMLTLQGLTEIARYADGIGVDKSLLIARQSNGRLGEISNLVRDAHAAGLFVHAWTFRPENHFLPVEYRLGDDPAARGNSVGEILAFLQTGLDGIFSDSPAAAIRAREKLHARQS